MKAFEVKINTTTYFAMFENMYNIDIFRTTEKICSDIFVTKRMIEL